MGNGPGEIEGSGMGRERRDRAVLVSEAPVLCSGFFVSLLS